MIKKSVSLCLSLVLLIGVVFCCPISASASTDLISSSYVAYIYPNTQKVSTNITLFNAVYGAKVTNLKSSTSKVKLSLHSSEYSTYITATSSNTYEGTAKISFKYKGKYYSTKYTVKKYTNPCKLFKIGSTNHTSKYNYKNTLWSKVAKNNQTFKIVTKSGWIITSVKVKYYDAYHPEIQGSDTYYPNSSSFSTKVTLYYFGHCGGSSQNFIQVKYKQKSTGKTIEQCFGV